MSYLEAAKRQDTAEFRSVLEQKAETDVARKLFGELARMEQGHMCKINRMREELT